MLSFLYRTKGLVHKIHAWGWVLQLGMGPKLAVGRPSHNPGLLAPNHLPTYRLDCCLTAPLLA
jgi:hypothetical protein